MNDLQENLIEQRPRVLLLTYHYDHAATMETRLSWRRAQHAAELGDVTAICAYGEPNAGNTNPGINVIAIPHNRRERFAMKLPWGAGFYIAYRLWHRRVLQHVRELHHKQPFDLVHLVSFCGYREPSECWKLGVPFVWGPVGGTHNFPWRYVGQLDFGGAVRELSRNIVNTWQLRNSRLVKRALHVAESVAVASESAKEALLPLCKASPQVLLETGIDLAPKREISRSAEEPLRVLWAGRLQCWKALPLLLRAMAELPPERKIQLRVLGEGPALRRWQKLAERLRVASQVQWVGWSDYEAQLPQYQWADLFAFTSLRDTSGTGLLEALAAGTPIVGMDHQGAADIMSDDSAVRIPVESPRVTIDGFRDALSALSQDRSRLVEMSTAAHERSVKFSWDVQRAAMLATYREVLAADGVALMPASKSRVEESVAVDLVDREPPQEVLLGR